MEIDAKMDKEDDPFPEMVEDFNAIASNIRNMRSSFEVLNATRGGNLEAFKRVRLEELLVTK